MLIWRGVLAGIGPAAVVLLSEPDRQEKVNDKKVMKYQSITAGMVIPILKHIYRPSNCF